MAFRFDKLTVKAQEAVQRAQGLAQDLGNPQITPLHILAALLKEEQGLVRPVVQKIGANLKQLESIVDGELQRLPKVSGARKRKSACNRPAPKCSRRPRMPPRR